jgi:hypothetical protein
MNSMLRTSVGRELRTLSRFVSLRKSSSGTCAQGTMGIRVWIGRVSRLICRKTTYKCFCSVRREVIRKTVSTFLFLGYQRYDEPATGT